MTFDEDTLIKEQDTKIVFGFFILFFFTAEVISDITKTIHKMHLATCLSLLILSWNIGLLSLTSKQ